MPNVLKGILILWESLDELDQQIQHPQLIGGDFKVITNQEEKLGTLPIPVAEIKDFRHCINGSNVEDLGFKEIKYTWWNGKIDEDCIFK